jgi:hypothetical protein
MVRPLYFCILYTCATMIREDLLNINIHYNHDVPLNSDKHKVKYIAAATLILVMYTVALSMLTQAKPSSGQTDKTISNVGSLKAIGVGVYWDAALTNEVSSIDWGVLEPGLSSNKTVYILNDGESSISLTLSTSNWNPSNASQFITLNWDYDGESIAPSENVKVTFELAISANISGITNFSFDIVIIGS